jgi:hypothetical protein
MHFIFTPDVGSLVKALFQLFPGGNCTKSVAGMVSSDLGLTVDSTEYEQESLPAQRLRPALKGRIKFIRAFKYRTNINWPYS